MRSVAVAILFGAILGACGDSHGSLGIDGGNGDVDAGSEFTCWPSIAPIPRGTVELGKGGAGFAEMPDTLNLTYADASGFLLILSTRMSGFDAGVVGAPGYKTNPATRVNSRVVDSGARPQSLTTCGERGWYVPNAVGGYDHNQELVLAFDSCWGTDALVGKQLEITVELADATGSYATDSKIVTIADTLDPQFHDIPTPPDCGQ